MLFAIANLLKGRAQNSVHFIGNDGPKRVMNEILKPNTTHKIQELCLGSIKQIANSKQTFRQFLSFSQENLMLLPQCLKKCFLESDEWHTCTTDLLLFKKIFNSGSSTQDRGQSLDQDPTKLGTASEKLLDAEQILNIDFKNIEKLKTLEMLEQKEDLSFVMHPLCKIRTHCYFTAAACISNGFEVDFLLNECEILARLLADLRQDSINDYIFQYLILFMQALAKDSEAIFKLMEQHAESLNELIVRISEQTKKATLAKTLIYLILRAPERLCSLEPRIFGKIFEMATNQDDPEITENVLWLQSSLIELKSSDGQYQHAVELCHQFKSAEIYASCIKQSSGPTVL